MNKKQASYRPSSVAIGSLLWLGPLLAWGFIACDGRQGATRDGTPEPPSAGSEVAWLAEVQEEVGLEYRHVYGGSGERYMVETMSGGGGLLDFDNDGWLDAFLVQGDALPGFAAPSPVDLSNRLFRNRGDGTFEDVSAAAGMTNTGYGIGACFGDIDNDGWTDVYVTHLGDDVLYRNRGGTFEAVTAAAGIDSPRWSSSCAFADYDRDGCLDLFVTNFVAFSIADHRLCGSVELPTYCGPDAYGGQPDQLYHNRCDGTFEEVAERAGVANEDPGQSKGLGVLWSDLDDDGDLDLYVANDSTRNFLYRNNLVESNGEASFTDVGLLSGTAFNDRGATEASMGVDAGDVDGDGRLDLFMTHLDFETNTLYRNLGGGMFLDSTQIAGLGPPSVVQVGFGTNFFDLEHDGDLDLFVANGHIVDNIHLKNPSLSFEQPNQLFDNRGGRFVEVSRSAGPHFENARVSRATAIGDLDNDGDLDLLIVNCNQQAVVLRNQLERRPEGRRHHWLQLRLLSRHGGRDAIGARARLEAGGRSWIAEARSGTSYLSQSDPRLHFGLGTAERIDRLEIRWPEGEIQEIPGTELAVDSLHVIRQPRAAMPENSAPTGAP